MWRYRLPVRVVLRLVGVVTALDRASEAATALSKAVVARDTAVCAASADGASLRKIGRAVGLSAQGVQLILNRAKS